MPRCKVCKTKFEAKQSFQCWCSPECGLIIARQRQAKAAAKKAKDERKADRAKREKLKTRSDWIKEAQREFNKYVRLRDSGRACICCSQPLGEDAIGGGYDAGHFRSVGSAPHLRFDERNVHGQRKYCNKYLSGNVVAYRVGLISRIGLRTVEALEADQTPRHYTIEDLRAIRDKYRAMARELEKETA